MVPGRFPLVAFAALLAMAGPAAAAMGQFHGTAAFPWTVEGERTATVADGAFVLRGDTGAASLVLHATGGTLTIVTHRAYSLVDHHDPKASITYRGRVDETTIPLEGATLRLADRRPEFLAALHGGSFELRAGSGAEPLRLDLLEAPVRLREDAFEGLRVRLDAEEVAPFTLDIPLGHFVATSGSGHASSSGTRLYADGATFQLLRPAEKPLEILAFTRHETRPGGIYNPIANDWTGPGTHRELVAEHVRIDGFTGRLDLQYADASATAYTAAADLDVLGSARFVVVEGTVAIEQGEDVVQHRLDGEDLRLAGRFALRSDRTDPAAGRATATATGDFTTVAYGAIEAEYDWTTAAAAVGLGALLLAGVAWLASHGKALLGLGGAGAVAGYARVHGAEVLEHPGRAAVYQRVQADPGVSFVELAAAVGVSESTLTYHVRVLEKNGFVTVVKEGRSLRLFDRQNAHYSRDRKHAAATLRNATTAAIAQWIARNPGIAQCDLATRFDLAASTINWHIKRLQQVGLVDARRAHPHTRYFLGTAWSELPVEEAQRLGMVPVAAMA